MSYVSLEFLAFTLVCGILYFLLPQKVRWTVLLVGSFVFYIVNAKYLSVFIVFSTLTLYGAGRWLEICTLKYKEQKGNLEKEERKALKAKTDRKKRLILVLTLLLNLGILLVFKYTGFFMGTVHSFAELFGKDIFSSPLRFALPLGISYYTLTGISYITDIYRGTVKAEKNPFKLSLFLVFFPHIVEGPLARYGELSQTLFSGANFEKNRVISGAVRVFFGFAKKLIIADRAAFLVNAVFENSPQYTGANLLLAALIYTFQIYAEFSGCMDIACGTSEIFGITLSENFHQPFFSKSIDEFWRRWHITLGAWLKDYVFYPVTLSAPLKKISAKSRNTLGSYYGMLLPVCLALFCVWFSNGFWHGASWKYVVYGLYYYFIMMAGKLLKPLTDKIMVALKIQTETKIGAVFSILRTNLIVLFGMLIFRSSSLTQAFDITKRIFTQFSLTPFTDGSLLTYKNFNYQDFIVLTVGFVALLAVGIVREKGINIRERMLNKNVAVALAAIIVLSALTITFGVYGKGMGASPFIYGQF